jgi:hypothetical protein
MSLNTLLRPNDLTIYAHKTDPIPDEFDIQFSEVNPDNPDQIVITAIALGTAAQYQSMGLGELGIQFSDNLGNPYGTGANKITLNDDGASIESKYITFQTGSQFILNGTIDATDTVQNKLFFNSIDKSLSQQNPGIGGLVVVAANQDIDATGFPIDVEPFAIDIDTGYNIGNIIKLDTGEIVIENDSDAGLYWINCSLVISTDDASNNFYTVVLDFYDVTPGFENVIVSSSSVIYNENILEADKNTMSLAATVNLLTQHTYVFRVTNTPVGVVIGPLPLLINSENSFMTVKKIS